MKNNLCLSGVGEENGASSPPQPELGSDRDLREVGRFRTVAVLGEGSGGRVFEARDTLTGKKVALKSLHNPKNTHELAILARLNHPCLIKMLDFGHEEGRAWFTMEYLEGAGCRERLRNLDELAFYRLARDLVWGLQYLHSQGIVHADLKPANIYVPLGGGLGRLLDFGLADEIAQPGACPRGTIAYMAPEVLTGSAPTPSSDLYSLGVVLFEALAGRLPFEGSSGDIVLGKLKGLPPSLRRARPDIPGALAEVIECLLSKAPEARLRSANEVALRLAEATGQEALFGVLWSRSHAQGHRRLVGRSLLTDTLEEHLGWTRGAGGVAWLQGEEGVGKSRILNEMVIRARLRGHEVVPLEAGPGLTPLNHLGRFLGLETPDWMGLDAPIEDNAQASYLAALTGALIERARRDGPMLITIESAERIDSLTRRGLTLLASLCRAAPVGVLAAACAEPGGDTASPRGADLIEVRALPLEGTQELFTAILGEVEGAAALAIALHARTGGNPQLVQDDLAQLIGAGALRLHAGRWYPDFEAIDKEPIRDLAQSRVAAHLARLSEDARRCLEIAAAIGSCAPLAWIEALLTGPHRLDRAELGESGLVEVTSEELIFAHPYIREGVYAHMSPETRAVLHARILGWIRSLDPDAQAALSKESMLRHAEAAGHCEEAVDYALEAAEEAIYSLAFSEAAGCLERGRKALRDCPPDREHALTEAALLVKLGDALTWASKTREAQEAYTQALGLGGPERAMICLKLGEARACEGDHKAALEAFDEAARWGETLTWAQSARHTFARGWSLVMLGQYEQTRQWAEAGLILARQREDKVVVARLLHLLGTTAWHIGELRGAKGLLHQALDLAEQTGEERVRADVLMALGTTLRYQGELVEAASVYQRAAAVYGQLGLLHQEAKLLNNQGVVLYLQGRWAEAQIRWEAYQELVERLGHSAEQVHAFNNLGTLYMDRGALDKAIDMFEQGIALASEIQYTRIEVMLQGNLGEALVRAGRHEEAAPILAACLRRAVALEAYGEVVETERRRAGLLLAENRFEDALLQICATFDTHEAHICDVERSHLHRILGASQRGLGHLREASETLQRALRIVEDKGARYEMAQVLIEQGALDRLRGRFKQAVEALQRAIGILEPLGARFFLSQARNELVLTRRSMRSRSEGLHQMFAVDEAPSSAQPSDSSLSQLVTTVLEASGYERGCLVLMDESGHQEIVHRSIMGKPCLEDDQPLIEDIARQVHESGSAFASVNLSSDPMCSAHPSVSALGARAGCCVSIKSQGRVIGSLYLDKPGLESEEAMSASLALLERLSPLFALALQNTNQSEANRRWRELLAVTSHEINRPLTSLLWYAQDMMRRHESAHSEDQEALSIIESQARRLLEMSKNLGEFARVEGARATHHTEPVFAEELLHTCADILKPLGLEKAINVCIDLPETLPECLGNTNQLTQVMLNLIGNAIKFTPREGRIDLRARLIRPRQNAIDGDSEPSLRFEVEDTGPGIPKEARERIFAPFYQHHSAMASKGSGLGLAIVHQVIKAHDGRVWVEEGTSGGARFCVELPLAPSDSAGPDARSLLSTSSLKEQQ